MNFIISEIDDNTYKYNKIFGWIHLEIADISFIFQIYLSIALFLSIQLFPEEENQSTKYNQKKTKTIKCEPVQIKMITE